LCLYNILPLSGSPIKAKHPNSNVLLTLLPVSRKFCNKLTNGPGQKNFGTEKLAAVQLLIFDKSGSKTAMQFFSQNVVSTTAF